MDFGVTSKLWEYGTSRTSAMKERRVDGSFAEIAAAKAAEKVTGQGNIAGMSFTDMWQTRFPGAYYHTMDASNIPQGVWERNDFPFEKFFQKDVDESVLDWNPNGANPAMDSSAVQSRLHSISGQKSQATKKKRREKYVELNEESALKRKMLEQWEMPIFLPATGREMISRFGSILIRIQVRML